jgi:hypothetical protein
VTRNRLKGQSELKRRLVAKFKLKDDGGFWDQDFPIFRKTALIPDDDELLKRFLEEFGNQSRGFSIAEQARELE